MSFVRRDCWNCGSLRSFAASIDMAATTLGSSSTELLFKINSITMLPSIEDVSNLVLLVFPVFLRDYYAKGGGGRDCSDVSILGRGIYRS